VITLDAKVKHDNDNRKCEYWNIFETHAKYLPETEQRKIALAFCQLVEGDLDDLGKKAMKIVADLCLGNASARKCKMSQKRLQANLPKENVASPYSVLIWSLQENSRSYPTWYSVSIAGSNVVDLNKATYPELTKIVKNHLPVY
jgi:hypothetical protein